MTFISIYPRQIQPKRPEFLLHLQSFQENICFCVSKHWAGLQVLRLMDSATGNSQISAPASLEEAFAAPETLQIHAEASEAPEQGFLSLPPHVVY